MPVVNLPLQIYVYALLVLPCIFSSALILPEYFSPFRVPLYLVSIAAVVPLLYKTPTQTAKAVMLMITLLLFAALLSGLRVEERQFLVNLRQWAVYSNLFICGIAGAVVAVAMHWQRRFAEHLLGLFSLLFLYGIYTYYAQKFSWPEPLYLLRPSPALIEGKIYVQSFFGWASPMRAYSVWYEPSYSAIVLACALPLLYFSAARKIKVIFVLSAIAYIYLTFSRSAWLVGGLFIIGHFSGLFRLRLTRPGLIALSLILGAVFVLFQVIAVGIHGEYSALGRILSVVNGMLEWLDSPLLGTGHPELISPLKAFHGMSHIQASIPTMLHWYGLPGLLIVLIPYWYISRSDSGGRSAAVNSFVYLSVIATTVGGALMMMSIFWFFWGFYMTYPAEPDKKP